MTLLMVLILALCLWSLWGFFSSQVEQAEYSVVEKRDDYEIRAYPAHIVAQTTIEGPRGVAMNAGFRIVAGYIFGDNTRKESIAMTAPVVVTAEGDSQTISFGMPRSVTLETLPTPNDSRVRMVMILAKKYAVRQFSWYCSDARVKQMQEKLLAVVTRDGMTMQGSPVYAGYNAPWTPPWMMRHEVMVEIVTEVPVEGQ